MTRKLSTAEFQRLVVDLCRASVLLRAAADKGPLTDGSAATQRLANEIDGWLDANQSRIVPIFAKSADANIEIAQDGETPKVVSFARPKDAAPRAVDPEPRPCERVASMRPFSAENDDA